jgi:hypothetical protein
MNSFTTNDQGMLVAPCCGRLLGECTCLGARVVNIFCPTGPGGGIRPDCKAGSGGGGTVSSPSTPAPGKQQVAESARRWFEADTYLEIKNASRGLPASDQAKKDAAVLQAAAENTNSGHKVLSRGEYYPPGSPAPTYQVGQRVTTDSLTATSNELTTSIALTNPNMRGLPRGGKRQLVKYENPEGLKGVSHELMAETIMPKGVTFQVKSVEQQAGTGIEVVTLSQAGGQS